MRDWRCTKAAHNRIEENLKKASKNYLDFFNHFIKFGNNPNSILLKNGLRRQIQYLRNCNAEENNSLSNSTLRRKLFNAENDMLSESSSSEEDTGSLGITL